MMHCTRMGKLVSMLVCLLLSVTGIVIGLLAFKIDVMNYPMIQTNLHMLIRPLYIAIGVAGVLALLHLLGELFMVDRVCCKPVGHTNRHESQDHRTK